METAFLLLPFVLVSISIATGMAAKLLDDRRNDMLEPWREAALAAGLTQVAVVRTWNAARLRGRAEPLAVELRRGPASNEETTTAVVIGGLPPSLTLRLETGATRRPGQRDLEVGDDVFDDVVYVEGPAALVRAAMDAGTRLRVRSMLGSGVTVQGGELYATVTDKYASSSAAPLKAVLPLLLEFAQRLLRPADIVKRLAAHATKDPIAGVRLANLLTLAREFPDHASTRPALLAALSDADDEVRLRAATMLAPEGTRVLLEIAGGENTDDACAGRAVTTLGAQLAPERTLAILAHALRARRLNTASACLAALGRSRRPEAVATLAKVLSRESGLLADAAARALGEYGQPEAEAALIAALDHHAGPARLAVAEALGQGGSVAAVEPLRRAEAHHSRDASFRRAARQAIAAIQARAGSASPGQLTLAEGESGRLSLEEDRSGHVSLAPASKGFPGRG